ncbi:MAG TPA: cupin domain-containing protein [Kofleriaceae bacterium]|nr:cupin domain-containing protein [Kofleriaceae bacterium]
MSLPRKPAQIVRAAEAAARSGTFQHPWNPQSEMTGSLLSRAAGLERAPVNLLRIPPGKESFTYHAHLHEEEWIYVLSGRAVVQSGETVHEIAAGDFVAFPTPSEPHILRNTSAEDVVYLTGGERAPFDVADYPREGKRMVRLGDRATVYDLASGTPFPFPGTEPL